MFYTFKLKNPNLFFAIFLSFVFIIGFNELYHRINTVDVFNENIEHCLIIDAGHGGIDGGAIAISGAKESDINLSFALKLQAIAVLFGENTLMTRTDDAARTDAYSYSEHEDLVYRTEIINSAENAVLISIHQNCYPTSQPSGAQVLYASSTGSDKLGILTHNNIINNLEPGNRRVAEPASEKLYITSHIKCPGILVECGFISNFSDLEKLIDTKYQTQFSAVLFASYIDFITSAY